MSEKNIKEEIRLAAKELGIEQVGFCIHEKKTAVCCLFPYYVSDSKNANISMYARGVDYHVLAKEKLSTLLSPFTENFEIRVDIGPTDNVEVALKSGLGVIGKNRLLINETLGSYFFIGYALTDLEIEPDSPLTGTCLSCNRCILSCPGGALSFDGFELSKCASHISQKKGDLSEDEIKILKKSKLIWGCDICQEVCPMNKVPLSAMEEFKKDRIFRLEKDDLEHLSNREFSEKYKDRAFAWRGKSPLLRNIELTK